MDWELLELGTEKQSSHIHCPLLPDNRILIFFFFFFRNAVGPAFFALFGHVTKLLSGNAMRKPFKKIDLARNSDPCLSPAPFYSWSEVQRLL